MPKAHKPRRGSMAYYPRKRAKSIVGRVRNWPRPDRERLGGFAGYKVGTLQVVKVEDDPNSPFYGQEVAKVATLVETPPLRLLAIRAYEKTPYGMKAVSEAWAEKVPKDIAKVFTAPKQHNTKEQLEKLREVQDRVSRMRAIVCTQPREAGIHKKKPEVFEVPMGGDPGEALNYWTERLGEEVRISDVFSPGEQVDVTAVTKGKGLQGVVKRFGVKILPRWHKHRKGHRKVASVGPARTGPFFTLPRAGQMGYHQRTEYNKTILRIGGEEEEMNPRGGWGRYGLVRNDYLLIEGTVPGAKKRLVKIRLPMRAKRKPEGVPKLVHVSTVSPGEGDGRGTA